MNAQTTKKSDKQMKNYKRWLLEAEGYRGEAGAVAYHRAVLLVKIYNDDEFREEVLDLDARNAMQVLDDLVQDLSLTFNEIRTMLAHYPDLKQWQDGKLRSMYDDMASESTEETEEVKPSKPRKTATVKELRSVEKDRDMLRSHLSQADEQIRQLREENERLRMELRALRAEMSTIGVQEVA